MQHGRGALDDVDHECVQCLRPPSDACLTSDICLVYTRSGRRRQDADDSLNSSPGGAGCMPTSTPKAEASAVVLVEGASDQLALEAVAARLGRDLDAEGVAVVPIGGAKNIRRFLAEYGPRGRDLRLAGLCDAGEE